MATTVKAHQPVAGIAVGATAAITDEYAAWLKAQGYATPAAGNVAGYAGEKSTSVAAAVDPTLAANREAAGAAPVLRDIAPAKAREAENKASK